MGGPLGAPQAVLVPLLLFFKYPCAKVTTPLLLSGGRRGVGGPAPPKRPGRVPRPPTLVAPLRGATRGAREGAVTLAQGASSLLHFKKGF